MVVAWHTHSYCGIYYCRLFAGEGVGGEACSAYGDGFVECVWGCEQAGREGDDIPFHSGGMGQDKGIAAIVDTDAVVVLEGGYLMLGGDGQREAEDEGEG